MQNKLTINRIAKISILAVIAYIFMFFEFPLPFIAPPFYKIDFSEVVVMIGGFALGPISAIVIEALKILLNLLFSGTDTMFIGELSNFIVGISFVVPASLIYRKNKTKNQAIIGMVVGGILMTIVGFITNLYAIIPAYVNIMGFESEMIIAMAREIFPFINSMLMLVLCCTTPFNLIKATLVSIITAMLYKHISPIVKK